MRHPSKYIGRACYQTTVERFLNTEKPDWIEIMSSEFAHVSGHGLAAQQRRAWDDEYDVLRKALAELPDEYKGLWVIFEYVMPLSRDGSEQDPGVRPDVVVLAQDTVVIIEFKSRPEYRPFMRKQVMKYRNRIEKWHKESKGLYKRAVLVLTKSEEPLLIYDRKLWICSKDKLAEVLTTFPRPSMPPVRMGAGGMGPSAVRRWRESEWLLPDSEK